MPPTHAKKPAAMKMCAHGGPLQCDMGCYSKGGEVHDEKKHLQAKWSEDNDEDGRRGGWKMPHEGRVNTGAYEGGKPTPSVGGVNTKMRSLDLKTGKYEMHGPKGKLYAEGGDVEPLDEPMKDDGDEELEDSLAQELLHAMEKKDKRGVRDAIEALVLQCMNKGGM